MENGIQPAGEALIQNDYPFTSIQDTVGKPPATVVSGGPETSTPVPESGKGGLVDVYI